MPVETLRIMPDAVAELIGEPATAAEPLPPALMLTADDLARELRASIKTIRRMDAAGRLPRAVKIGHGKRWPRETIIAWLRAGAPDRKAWEAFGDGPARRRRV